MPHRTWVGTRVVKCKEAGRPEVHRSIAHLDVLAGRRPEQGAWSGVRESG